MGTRKLNRLTVKAIASMNKPGLYCDGGGLYLQVATSGVKSWIFRYRSPLTQKLRDMGLGPLHTVGLPQAREQASAQRSAILSGLDPISARREESERRAVEAAKAVTFSQCAATYIDSHRAGWTNEKHADQWESTIKTYCEQVVGSLPVQEIDTGLVLKALEPIWTTKPETASRLRGRIENILDWAKARGYRTGENPARWKGHLNQILPAIAKKSRVVHHKAMPFEEVGEFMDRLRDIPGTAARCLEFTILTASRTNEATQARAEEFDLDAATWTIPASRMKAKKEHRVPLSPRAIEIVRALVKSDCEYVFRGMRKNAFLSNMAMLNPHGSAIYRSRFPLLVPRLGRRADRLFSRSMRNGTRSHHSKCSGGRLSAWGLIRKTPRSYGKLVRVLNDYSRHRHCCFDKAGSIKQLLHFPVRFWKGR